MTAVWAIDPHDPDPAIIARAADLIRAGKLVVMPTETVYGLAANALDEAAVRGIFTAKGRPSTNPLIVHVEDKDGVKRVASEFPEKAQLLADAFWPGPLSIVLPKQPIVPDVVTAGGPTVAVRCPDHAVARALIRAAGLPLAAPSANRSNELSPTRAEHVLKSLNGRIDAILDAGQCSVGIESTVVDLTGSDPRILRPGTITDTMIEDLIGTVVVGVQEGVAKSPGQMERHYCPKTPLLAIDEREFFEEMSRVTKAGLRVGTLGWQDWEDYEYRLYETLHRLDGEGYDFLLAALPPDEPEWAGVRDRLLRATTCVLLSTKTAE
jgi:L-threonylcarbamoyladenylate synthase